MRTHNTQSVRNFSLVAMICVVSAPAFAADRVVGIGPGKFATVQAAVDAAGAGDRVVVPRGVFRENVNVNKSDIQIVGLTGAVIDGTLDANTRGACISINGDDVTVQSLTLRAGTNLVAGTGARIQVSRCTLRTSTSAAIDITGTAPSATNCAVRGSRSGAIVLNGTDAVASGNSVTGCGTGISISGDGSTASKNTTRRTNSTAISMSGTSCTVSGNKVFVTRSNGIFVSGAMATVSGNEVAHSDGGGITVTGDDARVLSNVITGTESDALQVSGDRMTVSKNVVSQQVNDTTGISLSSNSSVGGGTVEDNSVTDCIDDGWNISTNNVTYRRNNATRCGSEASRVLSQGQGPLTAKRLEVARSATGPLRPRRHQLL